MFFKRSISVGGLLVVTLIALAPANALERPRFYFSLDYFLTGNIGDSLDMPEVDSRAIVISEGGTPLPSKTSSAALGGRVGVLFPLRGFDGYWVGGNVGHIKGPKAESMVNDPSAPPGTIKFESENTYTRALLEIAHVSELNKRLSFKFDVGMGLGRGKTEQTIKNEGYYAGLYQDSDVSKTSTKFTWEISPALILKGERFDVEFGVRYAQFPEIKESNETYKVEYSAFGFYTGIGF